MNNKILILVNHEIVVYNFRKELVQALIKNGYDVYISSPNGKKIDYLKSIGAKHIETKIDRHGVNILNDYKLYKTYLKMMMTLNPFIVLSYTIKPNIFGGFAAKKCKIEHIANITGLGSAVENKGLLQNIAIMLYKLSFSKINTVFFQNRQNMDFFQKKKISLYKHKLLPGSGVNLDHFSYLPYPDKSIINFAFISRIMKEKGIDYYLQVAESIKSKFSNVYFHVCGFCEENYIQKLSDYHKRKIIIYHGMIDDIKTILLNTHCVIHPSYYPEGMSNVLLEAAASGRPIITTNRSGCRETIDENISGYLVNIKDLDGLEKVIHKFINLNYHDKIKLGINGRIKMEKEFNRNIIVNEYLDKIRLIYEKE